MELTWLQESGCDKPEMEENLHLGTVLDSEKALQVGSTALKGEVSRDECSGRMSPEKNKTKQKMIKFFFFFCHLGTGLETQDIGVKGSGGASERDRWAHCVLSEVIIETEVAN